MPAAATVSLLATYLIVGVLVAGLAVIVTLLVRISAALADASAYLGLVPAQLESLEPTVAALTGALETARTQAT